jgi:hypothetical protein
LLGEHWTVLERAGQAIKFRWGENAAAAAVSVLLAASYRETEPQMAASYCWLPPTCLLPLYRWLPHTWQLPAPCAARDPQRLERVVDAVLFLVTCDKTCLTAAARHVLYDKPETPGELWVMEVIKTAFRLADVQHRREQLDFKVPKPRYGILSLLQGDKEAELKWLREDHHFCWPYSPEEMTAVRNARGW